ncbi:MAG: hypothetical protein E6K53_15110 [Gammaproteobacteria bacterium]|nr:MAG: hypothetical protein E6K53_15110 [Gammaproteobacteria bacterium]
MNTAVTNPAAASPLGAFSWLLKREYWEFRGGFFRAPFIIGAVIVAVSILAMITADFTAHRNGINISGMNIGKITEKLSAEDAAKFAGGIDVGLLGMCVPIMATLAFVTFFYLLGSLYNDRRDRSVLFWKSLPVSDLHTVLSKVVTAVLVAPIFAIAACVALQLTFLVVVTIYAALHGVNALPLLWSPTHLLSLWIKMLVMIPVNALWALPTVGWLLLCSSFVRSKPFLAAVVVPIIAGVIIGWINLMQQFALPSSWYWKNIFARLVFGTAPIGWLSGMSPKTISIGISDDPVANAMQNVVSYDILNTITTTLSSPSMWVGVVAGAAMIAGAVYFRQKRTEAYS